MKSWIVLGGLLLMLFQPALSGADKRKPPPAPTITKLAWLAGNWRLEKGGRVIDEQWMAPAAGLMLGMVRTVAKGRVLEHEFVQIREGPGGDLFYVSQVSGQKEVSFQIKSLNDDVVVFENQLEDFPQRISYALVPDGTMTTAQEGPGPGGEVRRVEYSYRKVP